MTAAAQQVTNSVQASSDLSIVLSPVPKQPEQQRPVDSVAQAVLQKQSVEEAPSLKRTFSEVSTEILEKPSGLPVKTKKEMSPPQSPTFEGIKSDLEKEVKGWHGKMLACFGGIVWIVHRKFLNSTVTSFRKEIAAADKKEGLIKVLAEYGQTLVSKRKLITKESALKQLDEGQGMLDRYLAALKTFPSPLGAV